MNNLIGNLLKLIVIHETMRYKVLLSLLKNILKKKYNHPRDTDHFHDEQNN